MCWSFPEAYRLPLNSDIYQRIMERLDGRGIVMVVDAEKDLLLKVLKYRPFLIKPNNHDWDRCLGWSLRQRRKSFSMQEAKEQER